MNTDTGEVREMTEGTRQRLNEIAGRNVWQPLYDLMPAIEDDSLPAISRRERRALERKAKKGRL